MAQDETKYGPAPIPPRQTPRSEALEGPAPPEDDPESIFYVLDYTASPIPGVGKFVRQGERIAPPEDDPIRERFHKMRELARPYQNAWMDERRFFLPSVRRMNSQIFYVQARFMADFTDDYEENAPMSAYYPNYQMMGYEQLRTYFTWRTRVRQGDIQFTSRSYAFLYLYELLHAIGSESPAEGFEKLANFARAYAYFDPAIEKYTPRWERDYRIYYGLPLPERPEKSPAEEFDDACNLSKYDIRKSKFYTPENAPRLAACWRFVHPRVEQAMQERGLALMDFLFYAAKFGPWNCFSGALFYPWYQQPDRRVALSEREIYLCRDNHWLTAADLPIERGSGLLGYLMKRMEADLRGLMKYKFKLTAKPDMLPPEIFQTIQAAGVPLEQTVDDAVAAYYREATKTVVTVDDASLARIRAAAEKTQQALTVEEETPPPPEPEPEPEAPADGWESLRLTLTEGEKAALAALLQGQSLTHAAQSLGIMPEVLAGGINEKAMDCIGDSLLDEELALYEDYREAVEEIVKDFMKGVVEPW